MIIHDYPMACYGFLGKKLCFKSGKKHKNVVDLSASQRRWQETKCKHLSMKPMRSRTFHSTPLTMGIKMLGLGFLGSNADTSPNIRHPYAIPFHEVRSH
jgi:hypothetical protein